MNRRKFLLSSGGIGVMAGGASLLMPTVPALAAVIDSPLLLLRDDSLPASKYFAAQWLGGMTVEHSAVAIVTRASDVIGLWRKQLAIPLAQGARLAGLTRYSDFYLISSSAREAGRRVLSATLHYAEPGAKSGDIMRHRMLVDLVDSHAARPLSVQNDWLRKRVASLSCTVNDCLASDAVPPAGNLTLQGSLVSWLIA
jgi:hypothetical protein